MTKKNRRDQMMAKENKSDKQMKKIAELDKQIDHDQHELLNASELSKTDGPILKPCFWRLFCKCI